MPYKDKPIEKLYYSIGEVAEMFEVNVSLLRFWEKEFDILKPKKNKKGNRMFTVKDLDNLKIIYHLVKERGFTLDGAKKKLKDNKSDTINNIEIVNRLKDIRQFLVELREEL
jgi:DNA-binding transcriptional MerR regulator|tara:strand:+ start:384 stop:719 length:336 start_codon:yes stop_codon:yes gene_type:complete